MYHCVLGHHSTLFQQRYDDHIFISQSLRNALLDKIRFHRLKLLLRYSNCCKEIWNIWRSKTKTRLDENSRDWAKSSKDLAQHLAASPGCQVDPSAVWIRLIKQPRNHFFINGKRKKKFQCFFPFDQTWTSDKPLRLFQTLLVLDLEKMINDKW